MSSPSYMSVCCCERDSDDCNDVEKSVLLYNAVDIICLVTSLISLLGIVYLLLPRPDSDLRNTLSTSQTRILAGQSVRQIIHTLIFCDSLAILGLIVRSIVKLTSNGEPSNSLVFCNFINLWIQLFYGCSYFWTIVYGAEILFSVKGKEYVVIKYILGFVPPIILSTIQILMLSYSHNKWCLDEGVEKVIMYITMIIPIILVVFINPIIFYSILKSVRKIMIGNLGRFGTSERDVLEAARFKFSSIVLVFVFCWLPNIVFAMLQLFNGRDELYNIFLAVAAIQAITNPLQGLLNCLVYRGWPGAFTICSKDDRFISLSSSARSDLEGSIEVQINSLSSRRSRSTESDPILNFRSRREQYT